MFTFPVAHFSAEDDAFVVDNSIVLNRGSNQYLTWAPTSAGNRDTWTLSFWVKRVTLGTDQFLFSAGADANNFTGLSFTTSNTLRYEHQDGGSRTDELIPNMTFVDVHSWYHIVCAVDTTSGTEAHRVRLYINGVEESLSGTPNYPGQNVDTDVNQADEHRFGSRVTDGADDADVYLSEVVFVDGTQKQATDFAEFKSGIFRPIDVSEMSLGTNGYYLDFKSSGNLGEFSGKTTKTKTTAGSTEANYNDGGGHAATKDGNRSQNRGQGLANSSANNDILTPGRDFGTGTSITGARVFAPNDNGFEEGGGSGTARLYGSDTSNNAGDKSLQGSASYTGATGEVIAITGATGTFDHWWVELESAGSGNSTNCAELEFFTGAGTVSSNYFVEVGSPAQSGDSPTSNFAVMTPLVVGGSGGVATFSEGNLKVVQSNGSALNAFGSIGLSSGKWHYEVTLTDTVDQFGLGIIPVENVTGNTNQFWNNGIGAMVSGSNDGKVYNNGSNVATITSGSGSDGQTFSCEIDLDNDQLEWFNNAGSSRGTYSFTQATANGGRYLPCVHCNDDATYVVNFGASTFSKTPTTNFTGISAALVNEASAPAIQDGTSNFVVATDTESNIASTLASARSSFSNYLDLLVNRDTGESRLWRFSHDTSNEHAQGASSTYGSTSTLSGSDDWIGLSWKVDGTAKIRAGSVSHSNGSDTTVSFTTVGTTRYWVMVFERGSSKPVTFRHPEMDSGYLANFCNQSNPASDDRIHTFAATSFKIDSDEATNTYDYIVWPEISGFCSLFKFNCNSNADGPTIFMDLAPKASFIRANSGAVSNTWLTDNVRQTYNVLTVGTAMDGANAEGAMTDVDYLSNGIKYRENGDTNEETDSIGISWADHASAGTSPATAR